MTYYFCKATTAHLNDEDILKMVVQHYADPERWVAQEKDTGEGFIMRSPWAIRDRGSFARSGLDFIEKRKKERAHL